MKAKSDSRRDIRLDVLLHGLAEIGRVECTTTAQRKKRKQLMEQCVRFVAPDCINQPGERVPWLRSLNSAEYQNLKLLFELAPVYQAYLTRKEKSGKGGDTMRLMADERHKLLDEAIAGCMERNENPGWYVEDWAHTYKTPIATVYRRIRKQLKPKQPV